MYFDAPTYRRLASLGLASALLLLFAFPLPAQEKTIPPALQPWKEWATWDDAMRFAPTAWNSATDPMPVWPSEMELDVSPEAAQWKLSVQVFADAWLPLPGNGETWPRSVSANGEPVAVIERSGRPAVKLTRGRYELAGEFEWASMPQQIPVPPEIGLLTLQVNGKPVRVINRDADGKVWLKRKRVDVQEKNSLSVQVYRAIEDGIPMWLRSDIELTVSGKSREENLGWVLPEGWQLSTVESPVPVALDDRGRMKAQVRAGKWTISVHAFRTDDVREIGYAEDAQPITDQELIAYRSRPEFRLAELTGVLPVDVTQTTFPQKWRSLPVFQWDTATRFGLDEKLRGMGRGRADGLNITREIWLDEDGNAATWHDVVVGKQQQRWRLDAADPQKLGAVRVNGTGQLITASPESKARGVELRARNFKLDAVGRTNEIAAMPATGWRSPADQLTVTMNLPPGWRMLAVLGVDSVSGDWLTAWTLLDLFLLLIFTMAVFRIWGFTAGIVAFAAFGLAYHEPDAPRLTWLFLLIPIALLTVAPEGLARRIITGWKVFAMVLLVLHLAPFVTRQVQTALYPQLESRGVQYQTRNFWGKPLPRFGARRDFAKTQSYEVAAPSANVSENPFGDESDMMAMDGMAMDGMAMEGMGMGDMEWAGSQQIGRNAYGIRKQAGKSRSRFSASNMNYDAKAQIQTGPAQPQWRWNQVVCAWDGPVSEQQQICPIMMSLNQHRILTLVQLSLLGLLAMILCGGGKFRFPRSLGFSKRGRKQAAAVAIAMCISGVATTSAVAEDFPDAAMLKTLRERLVQSTDAFPRAAEIADVALEFSTDNDSVERIRMTATVHSAAEVAVPLPGKIPAWSPVAVSVDGKPARLVTRRQDYLWVVVSPGVHQVVVDARLPDVSEWEMTWLLKPRSVSVAAEGWNVTGVRPNGVPEDQIFFARQRQETDAAAAWDRKEFNAVVVVDRHLETGLIWQVRNEVSRIGSAGKAVSIRVPLLPGERVLTANAVVVDQMIEVRLGAGEPTFSWESELPVGQDIELAAAPSTQRGQWVERWHLISSPVWNVKTGGLDPIFEASEVNMIPVWHPWPGESVKLTFSEPEAVAGQTVTLQEVCHETTLGSRQRTMDLFLLLECSVGSDFRLAFPADAEISSVKVAEKTIPVRREGATLIVPLQPGKQPVRIAWRSDQPLKTVVAAGALDLPIAAANITTKVSIPSSRWVLWAEGPLRGPAVQFWVILIVAVVTALVLCGFRMSPLSRLEWVLLVLGLTQVPLPAALLVIGWLFVLSWRGKRNGEAISWWMFNLGQIAVVLLTVVSLCILVAAVGEGLLGNPEMFIVGNGSTPTSLIWFEPLAGTSLPETSVVSVSVWVYRLLMLFWALWLASALLRWLNQGWQNFSKDGFWRPSPSEKWNKSQSDVEIVEAPPVPAGE